MNDIRPKNPFLYLKYRFLEWRYDRILKLSRFKSWMAYLHWNDIDFDFRGDTIKAQLFGYPYVGIVNYQRLEEIVDPLFGPFPNMQHVENWCNRYCKKKFRIQYERVLQNDFTGEYHVNSFGVDEIFVGFKDERDFILFTLRWS